MHPAATEPTRTSCTRPKPWLPTTSRAAALASLDQPVHGRPVYHPCFDCDVFVVWRQGVELLSLCRLGRLPRVRADRGLGEPAAMPTVVDAA